jgi:hypothetical protein
MYGTYLRDYEDAQTHYTLSAQMTSDQDLKIFSYLSLSLLYLCAGKTFEFYETIDKITTSACYAKNIKALVLFVSAINTYLHDRGEDCKTYIGQSLNISQEAEMGRLQALSSLLLSTLRKSEDNNALKIGISWAEKLSDVSLQLWGLKQQCGELIFNLNN